MRIYNALEIAEYIINKCTCEEQPISNLQLQKILYCLQRKYLKDYHMELFSDEIHAWQFGPVVIDVYFIYCGFGSTEITVRYEIKLRNEDIQIIDPMVEELIGKYPWDLIEDVHAVGKAWDQIYKKGSGNGKIIPKELIKQMG